MGMEATHAEGQWLLHGQRTQTEATGHLRSAPSLLSRSWVGSRPRGKGDARGPCFRETLPPPSSPHPAGKSPLRVNFLLTCPVEF